IYAIWNLFDQRRKFQFRVLVFLYMIGAALETASISIIFPYITAIISGDSQSLEKVIFYVKIVLFLFLIKSIYLYGLGIIKRKYILHNYKRTSEKLLGLYLDQDYQSVNNEDSSVLINNINKYTGSIFITIQNMLEFIAELMIIIMLLVYMCIVDITLSAAIMLVYALVL